MMYYAIVSQCTQSLAHLLTCLDKAEQHAAAKKFDTNVLMNSRLAPDMQPFTYQVRSACDYAKAAAAWPNWRASGTRKALRPDAKHDGCADRNGQPAQNGIDEG